VTATDERIATPTAPPIWNEVLLRPEASQTLRAVVWLGRKLDDAVHAGDLRVEGDRSAVARLVGLFPRPEPAAPAAVA
jgi:hypothetical protein